MKNEPVTFSFGENWSDLVSELDQERVASSVADIQAWLDDDWIRDKSVLDIGSGSGIHSLGFLLLGAKRVHSFDNDPMSVSATRTVWEDVGSPKNWSIGQGSVLDRDYLENLGHFDVVYSWGVLHHTGDLWTAMENAADRVNPGGYLWIAIYQKGPRYPQDIALKRRYNAASSLGKRVMEGQAVLRLMISRLRHLKNPLTWNQRKGRGMDVYHDIKDWLGGLPYEVASENEIVQFGSSHGLVMRKIRVESEGGCSKYVFQREG